MTATTRSSKRPEALGLLLAAALLAIAPAPACLPWWDDGETPVTPDLVAPPAPPPEAPKGPLWFLDRSEGSGLDQETIPGEMDHEWVATMAGQGIALLDYDGDGKLDVFQPSGSPPDLARQGKSPPSHLYRNLGDGSFEEVTERAGVAGNTWSFGASAVDYDGDGDTDLYVANMRQDFLYQNQGDGTFRELARESGIVESDYSNATAWSDFDGDGDLDVYVATFVVMDYERGHPPVNNEDGTPCNYCGPGLYRRVHDRLYLNDGDGRFTDASHVSGVQEHQPCYGFTAVPADYDLDGDLDIFVANDVTNSPNFLLVNQGSGYFVEQGVQRGVGLSAEGQDQSCMGVAVFDLNADGLADIAVTNFFQETNTLYLNKGDGQFQDITKKSGFGAPSLALNCWGIGLFDFNHDGWLDCLVNAGHVHIRDSAAKFEMPMLLLAGAEGGTFEQPAPSGDPKDAMELRHSGRGLAFGDIDNDGDVDAVAIRQHHPPALLINRAGDGKPSLTIRLQGKSPNIDGIGARVKVEAGGRTWWTFVAPHQSFISSNDPRQHVGLAGARGADKVSVVWPDGSKDEVTGVEAGELTVRQGQGRAGWKAHAKGW